MLHPPHPTGFIIIIKFGEELKGKGKVHPRAGLKVPEGE